MLVLSRKKNESIIIGDDVRVTIVDIRGDKVRLGIDAPPEVSVHRREVYEAIQRENKNVVEIRYRKFQSCLDSKDFESAFNLFYANKEDYINKKEIGTREEIDKMVYGLYEN